jgi:hypothetical protein
VKLSDFHSLFQVQMLPERPPPGNAYEIGREVFDLGARRPRRQLARLKAQERLENAPLAIVEDPNSMNLSLPASWKWRKSQLKMASIRIGKFTSRIN